MRRRCLLAAGAGLVGGLLLGGHTPYRQWEVYRQKHLLVGCHRGDARAYRLAREVVAALADHLPAASARVARARHGARLASLLGTGQLPTAVLAADEAGAMAAGNGGFAAYGPLPLRMLARLGDRLFVATTAMPARHAWQLTGVLIKDAAMATESGADTSRQPLPWHAGSLRFLQGMPLPAGAEPG